MAIHTGKQNIPCICVTNRTLCRDDFLTRIEHIAKKGVADAILLREKDLTEREYLELAEKVLSICKSHNRRCILLSCMYRHCILLFTHKCSRS